VVKVAKYLEKNWLRNEIEVLGRTYKEIAEECGVGYTTIANRARSYGIKHGSLVDRISTESAKELLRDYDWLYEQYIVKNKSYADISKEFSLKRSTISRWVIRHGLEKPLENKLKQGSPKVIVSCSHCGKEYESKPSALKDSKLNFCSHSCCSTHYYYSGVGEKMHRGSDDYYKTDRGKSIAIENGKRASKMLSDGYKTSIEKAVEHELTSRGIEFESQKPYKLGIVDIFIEPNIYIFCDGDYWHAFEATQGKAKPTPKQARQIAKDRQQTNYLRASGKIVFRFWEHEINEDVGACVDIVMNEINEASS
jgi:G:T-mismatch repair DNA endonuclease (very short patch repair protein)/transposase